jgi:carboxylesterase type B
MKLSSALSGLAVAATVLSAPTNPDKTLRARADLVTVAIPSGTVVGASVSGVDSFNGIPFADSPTGSLRLKPPQRKTDSLGTFDATGVAPACPQMIISSDSEKIIASVLSDVESLPFLKVVTGQEDCLSISVQRPAGTKAGDNLPVLFWIFGGGFEFGATNEYDAASLLGTAVDQSQPFVFVAVNYRVAGFGFMPGSEILKDGSANLGLLDQRMGLEWVADNIASFGGDPDKVTIWGESAGSISVLDQMALYGGDATYNGKPLFRAGIMDSGSVVPAEPVDGTKGQAVYDSVVEAAGCSGESDTLECLRGLPYDAFLNASNYPPAILSYNSVALSYLPRPDGTALPDSPDVLIQSGKYYAVPMIIGDQEDEGTLFSLFQSNLTTTSDLVEYFSSLYFLSATEDQLTAMVNTYSPLPTDGSPFRTGLANELYPAFKRLAAILGDLTFTLARRLFLTSAQASNPSVPSWSYLASYDYGTPILGTFHASYLLQVFYGVVPDEVEVAARTYYLNFLYNMDPNSGVTSGLENWPQWESNGPQLMWFETATETSTTPDDFRSESYDYIVANVKSLYI